MESPDTEKQEAQTTLTPGEESHLKRDRFYGQYFPDHIPPSVINDLELNPGLDTPVTRGNRFELHENRRYKKPKTRIFVTKNITSADLGLDKDNPKKKDNAEEYHMAAVYDEITGKLIAWGTELEITKNY